MKSAKGKITTTKTVWLDQEALSLAIRAELAVVEAEKEKEAERIKNLPNYYWNMRMPWWVYSNIQITKEPPFICKNWYSGVMYKQFACCGI